MKLQIIACSLFVSISIRAQTVTPTVISANGGYNSSSSGSIAWTIGEPVSATYSKPANITTVGFHQTEMEVINFIGEKGQDLSNIVVFPNPVGDQLLVNFQGMESGVYLLSVTDAAGKQIMVAEANVSGTSTVHTMNMSTVAEGNYMMTIRSKQIMKNIKINKVNH